MPLGTTPEGQDEERDVAEDHPAGQRMEPADEGIIVEAAANVVHESDDFPSGGGEGVPGGVRGDSVKPSDRGSTGRGSTDAGKTDGGGSPGGGMAGSSGG